MDMTTFLNDLKSNDEKNLICLAFITDCCLTLNKIIDYFHILIQNPGSKGQKTQCEKTHPNE